MDNSVEIPLIKKDMTIMNDKIDTIVVKFDKMESKMESYFERLDSRFAGKWTEKLLIFIGSAVGLAMIGAFIKLIMK